LKGTGRVFVSPRLPELLETGSALPSLQSRVVKLARAQIEELIPGTGAPFDVRYVFDTDPDGTYGYYNRLAHEALTASTPLQAMRLLRVYGSRWLLDDQGQPHPALRPVTGFEVAGRRFLLWEIPEPLAELRWAAREHRRNTLSGALDLARSQAFRAESDVVLPGREDREPAASSAEGRLLRANARADGATADVEAASPGHVVFGRTYFPAWRARVDGRVAPVLVANARDLAVAVPAGNHRVEFEYDRAPFHRGVLLQAAVFLLILAAALVPSSGARLPEPDAVDANPRHGS
jgi:hypothetical protein